MSDVLELAKDLIQIDSVTPNDNGCQTIIANRLEKIGFNINHLKFGQVDNLWAMQGNNGKVFVFAGHTDVVPVGDVKSWHTNPFNPEVKEGILYGRGAADMKGSLAAMVIATERFIKDFPQHKGKIGFLITSDEEGPAIDGTIKVAHYLKDKGQNVDYCLVGEPSSVNELADFVKNGRRGSLNARLKIIGKQGHIAYPHLAKNPIHLSLPALNDLCNELWDEGNDYFPATSFQISNINAGVGATNVIPEDIEIDFNFRYSTQVTAEELKTRTLNILNKYNLNYKIDWHNSGNPFLTSSGKLIKSCLEAIKSVKNINAELSTSGGTSDGRFIVPILNSELVELGHLNATIHQVNECVKVKDLEDLTDIYYQILKKILV
jgi:succinyl-diaminopimelate desuccinylase